LAKPIWNFLWKYSSKNEYMLASCVVSITLPTMRCSLRIASHRCDGSSWSQSASVCAKTTLECGCRMRIAAAT